MRNPFRKPEDPEVKAAYEKAKREARLERAAKEGRQAELTKPQSFFDKVGSFGKKMFGDGSAGLDFGGGLFGEPKTRRKRKRRRK